MSIGECMIRENRILRFIFTVCFIFMPLTVLFLALYKILDNTLYMYLTIACLAILGVSAILVLGYIAAVALYLLWRH